MRRLALALLSLATALPACRPRERTSPPPAAPAPAGVEYRNGRWFDGSGFRERTMYVVGHDLSSARPERIAKVVDLDAGWVVPPYAEGHNHWLEPAAVAAYDALYLRDGVFYLKDMANARVVRRGMDAALNRPATVDFVSANEGWTGPGGHPYQIALQFLKFGSFPKEWTEKDLDRNVVNVVETPADVEARWPDFAAGRPDFVKVFLLYSEEYAKRRANPAFLYERGLDPALVPLIASRAHAAGLRLAAHAYTAADFRNAVAGGADDVAHFPGTGWNAKLGDAAFRITEADAALAAKRGATVTTTLSWLGERMESDPAVGKHILDAVIRPNLDLLRRAGVPILIGSDQFRKTPAAEAALLARWRLFSNAELLKAWCETTPRAIFPKRKIGRLEDGWEASFLVLTGDPLADFANTARISMRVKQGETLAWPPDVPFPPLKM
jgi:imidazolonepropionase-like amidohydrolase